MTPQERERMAEIQQSFDQVVDTIKEAFGEDILPEGGIELILGTMMATVDALFAIRDEQPWRGLTDPKEIARQLLREAQLGEQ